MIASNSVQTSPYGGHYWYANGTEYHWQPYYRESGRRQIIVPTTVKRKKPSDLFASGTARTTQTLDWIESTPLGYHNLLSKGRIEHQTKPCWYYLGSPAPIYSYSYAKDELLARLDNKILEQIKGESAQLAVDLVELRKTRELFVGLALETVDFLRGLRSGRTFKQLFRDLSNPIDRGSKKLSNKWLEYTYGISPTLGSIETYHDLLSEQLQVGLQMYSSATVRRPVRKKFTHSFYESYENRTVYTHRFFGGYEFAHARYRFTVSDSTLRRLSQYGIANPLAVAWELVPYSFVIDWFLDVGGYLNRMDAALGISDLIVIKSSGCKVKSTLWTESDKTSAGLKTYLNGSASGNYHIVERQAPSTRVQNHFLGFREMHISQRRLINALALLNQIRR